MIFSSKQIMNSVLNWICLRVWDVLTITYRYLNYIFTFHNEICAVFQLETSSSWVKIQIVVQWFICSVFFFCVCDYFCICMKHIFLNRHLLLTCWNVLYYTTRCSYYFSISESRLNDSSFSAYNTVQFNSNTRYIFQNESTPLWNTLECLYSVTVTTALLICALVLGSL